MTHKGGGGCCPEERTQGENQRSGQQRINHAQSTSLGQAVKHQNRPHSKGQEMPQVSQHQMNSLGTLWDQCLSLSEIVQLLSCDFFMPCSFRHIRCSLMKWHHGGWASSSPIHKWRSEIALLIRKEVAPCSQGSTEQNGTTSKAGTSPPLEKVPDKIPWYFRVQSQIWMISCFDNVASTKSSGWSQVFAQRKFSAHYTLLKKKISTLSLSLEKKSFHAPTATVTTQKNFPFSTLGSSESGGSGKIHVQLGIGRRKRLMLEVKALTLSCDHRWEQWFTTGYRLEDTLWERFSHRGQVLRCTVQVGGGRGLHLWGVTLW